MAIFDWQDVGQPPANAMELAPAQEFWVWLQGRFDTAVDAVGVPLWRNFVWSLRDGANRATSEDARSPFMDAVHGFIRAGLLVSPSRQCVFVSHQQANANWAERVAWEATEVGFDYWLDVHDPTLKWANAALLPGPLKAAMVAGVIEMALLNSTHLASLQTAASRASQWVPYEFGRAKERQLTSSRTASWFESGISRDPSGDYRTLAICADDRANLVLWLDREAGPPSKTGPNTIWGARPKPGPLPN